MTTKTQCAARAQSDGRSLRCLNPGKAKRQDHWLCGVHLRVYDAHRRAPKAWRWKATASVLSDPTAGIIASLATEPESDQFLDDTPPPVWVDSSGPHARTEGGAIAVDSGEFWPNEYNDELDEPPSRAPLFLAILAAVVLAFLAGIFVGKTVADDGGDTNKATLATEVGPPKVTTTTREPAAIDRALKALEAKRYNETVFNEAVWANAAVQRINADTAALAVENAQAANAAASSPAPVSQTSGAAGGESCYGGAISDAIVNRESGGNPRAVNPSSGAAGCFQIIPDTWAGYGGYASAADAPISVQKERAAQLWAGGAGCSHWSACGTTGGGGGGSVPPSSPQPQSLPQVVYDQPLVYWWVNW